MDEDEKQFRETNNIPSWEVHHKTVSMSEGIISYHYDHERTMKNFMKLVAKKLDME